MTRQTVPPLAATPSRPLTDDDFATLMSGVGPFERRPHLACAVSGGADSLALVLFAQRWAERRGGKVTALTVDHGLRPEAADEARRVGDWLTPRGIAHHILVWTGEKPATGVQQAARAARYALLGQWCRDAGVLHLLLAHNRDDQAETLLLRLGAGSGPDGLAAMAAVRETPDMRLLRPLLAVPGSALRASLVERGQAWIEDPSNRDDRFARVRARRAIAEGGLSAEALAHAAGRFGRVRAALEASASALLAETVRVHPAGFARLSLRPLVSAPDEVSLRALARVIAAIGGRAHAPRLDRLERLHRQLLGGAGVAVSATLGSCRVVAGQGVLLICREDRGIPAPVPVRPGLSLIWDRRFAIRFAAAGEAENPRLAGLGAAGWSEIVRHRPALKGGPLPDPVHLSLPALIDGAGVVTVPHLNYRRPKGAGAGVAFAEIRFSPPNPLAGNGFFLPNHPDILSL
ncbi:MAG TPA: tRNA lysidine(34) synthetase TilS [Rhodospirillales bacterium]